MIGAGIIAIVIGILICVPLGDETFMIEYFTQANPSLGNISWTMAVVWVAALAVAVYLLRSYRTSNPVRSRFVRQAATIAAALSVFGIVLLILKFAALPVLSWRLWSYLVAIASLAYWGYAIYRYNQLPTQVATSRAVRTSAGSTNRGGRGVRVYQANGAPTPPKEPRAPRPVATTTRREARRDKKRKGR